MDNADASTYVARFPSVDRMTLLYEIACGGYWPDQNESLVSILFLGLEYLHEKKIVHGDLRAVSCSP